MATDADLPIYTIYWSPRDFPGRWVMRRFLVRKGYLDPIPDSEVKVELTYDEVLAHVPEGLHKQPREVGDDVSIRETWF